MWLERSRSARLHQREPEEIVTVSPDDSSDHLLKAISECVDGMVTSFVMVCSFVDEDGNLRIYADTLDDQRCHVSLGLLAFATAVENKRAVADWETE
jgi:hypothetical protein